MRPQLPQHGGLPGPRAHALQRRGETGEQARDWRGSAATTTTTTAAAATTATTAATTAAAAVSAPAAAEVASVRRGRDEEAEVREPAAPGSR